MRLVLVLMASLAVAACGDDGEPTGDAGESGPTADGGESGGGGGGSSDDGGSSGGGGGSSGGGGSGVVDASSRTCGPELHGTGCDGTGTCTYTEECTDGRCECSGGEWTCSERDTCEGMCPQASETSCGDSCSSDAMGCLCRCGGGPDFTSCDCVGGSWDCGGGCRGG